MSAATRGPEFCKLSYTFNIITHFASFQNSSNGEVSVDQTRGPRCYKWLCGLVRSSLSYLDTVLWLNLPAQNLVRPKGYPKFIRNFRGRLHLTFRKWLAWSDPQAGDVALGCSLGNIENHISLSSAGEWITSRFPTPSPLPPTRKYQNFFHVQGLPHQFSHSPFGLFTVQWESSLALSVQSTVLLIGTGSQTEQWSSLSPCRKVLTRHVTCHYLLMDQATVILCYELSGREALTLNQIKAHVVRAPCCF